MSLKLSPTIKQWALLNLGQLVGIHIVVQSFVLLMQKPELITAMMAEIIFV